MSFMLTEINLSPISAALGAEISIKNVWETNPCARTHPEGGDTRNGRRRRPGHFHLPKSVAPKRKRMFASGITI
jgi:hypothetical protein